MQNSSRLYHCHRCHVQVIICSSCDRGQRYCAGKCSADARNRSLKRAAKKYQSTRTGQFNNAQRQARFRVRKKKVTHHGSPPVVSHVVLQSPLNLPVNRQKSVQTGTNLVCHHCGEACGVFLRHDFLRYCRFERLLRQP